MNNFDLKKYLANNPLLENKLSPQEQDIVDDILSVSEGIGEIMEKIKSYARKGLLTTVIIASLVSQLNAQGQTQLANQVQKQATELVSTPASKPKFVYSNDTTGNSIIYSDTVYPQYGYIFEGYTIWNGMYRTSYRYARFKDKETILNALQEGIKMEINSLKEINSGFGVVTIYKTSSGEIQFQQGKVDLSSTSVRKKTVDFTLEQAQQAIQDIQNFTP